MIRQSLREQVRDELLRRIGDGVLAPGQRIVETALAKELGVSPIPVREAIRELVTMGILESGHHKGGWVREVSIPETIQALQVRSALESLAARLAGPALRDRMDVMRVSVRQIVAAARQRDFVSFQQQNQIFHQAIVEASGNAILQRMWKSLAFDVRTRAIMDYIAVADPVEIAREHEAIADSIQAGDTNRTVELLAEHSAHLVTHLREAMERHRSAAEMTAQRDGEESARPEEVLR